MKQFVLVSLLLVALAACQPPSTPAPDPAGNAASPEGKPGEATPPPAEKEEPKALNSGDVEWALNIAAELAPESKADTIKVDTLVDMLKRPNLLTLTVAPPPPQELWIRYAIKSRLVFMDTPVVLRVKFIAEYEDAEGKSEEKELDALSLVITDQAFNKEIEHKVEVLGKLGALPKSVLVRTRSEALLMPVGTDPASLDPATATTDEDRTTGAITSCPVRINFE